MEREKSLRGVISLPVNMIGWVIMIAIFAVIVMFLYGFLVEFQTVPSEAVEKPTACDVAYTISLWDKATTHPNIFSKSFIESWGQSDNKMCASGLAYEPSSSKSATDTANIIFEKLSKDYFIPDSDIYLEIATQGQVYKMYLPPESGSVFCECARPTYTTTTPVPGWTLWDIARTGDYFEQKAEFEKYKKDMTQYNAIYAQCQLPVFVEDGAGGDIQPASVKASITTNLATQLRDGIYRIGVKGEKSIYYPLGPYPQGCIVNEGAAKVVEDVDAKQFQKQGDIISNFINNLLFGTPKMAIGFVKEHKLYANCGFSWDWNTVLTTVGGDKVNMTTLTVDSMDNRVGCPLQTRIPGYIYDEGNLEDKLCTPKEAFARVWLPQNDLSNYQYFLKVESARSSWTETDEAAFCKNRCNDASPWWWIGPNNLKDCQEACDFLADPKNKDKTCQDRIDEYNKLPHPNTDAMKTNCNFAKSLIHLYRNLPEDAINIRYIVVSSDKLQSKSFGELNESDYYSANSACSTWKSLCKKVDDPSKKDNSAPSSISGKIMAAVGISGGSSKDSCCSSSADCNGMDCVAGVCEKCSDDYWGFCSPAYLEHPVTLGLDPLQNGLFTCQKVYDQTYPLNTKMNECLPMLQVYVSALDSSGLAKDNVLQYTTQGAGTAQEKAVISLDCSQNPDAQIRWKIDASGLCCPTWTSQKDDKGNEIKVCNTPPDYCLNMKFWPNMNSSNVSELVPRQIFSDATGQRLITQGSYIFEIDQQVCRNGKPFNNAEIAFITADYPVKGEEFKYSVSGSEINLK